MEFDILIREFDEVDFEDAEGLNVSEVGESFEGALVLGFVRWRITYPPNVRRQDFGPFIRDILAPPLELRLEPETDVMKQMELAPWNPSFRNESTGFERGTEAVSGYLSNVVDDPVDDFVVLEHGDVGRWISRCGRGRTSRC